VNLRKDNSAIGTIVTGNSPGSTPYIGRFAPSPTGPLHFGSLLAAVASFLEARRHGGQWLLRVEDIDPPRSQPGATNEILDALERYGFEWDGPVSYQSASREAHEHAIELLLDAGKAYRCSCSRRDLAAAPRGALGIIYPGTCRAGCSSVEGALRVRTDNEPIVFVDRLQGPQSQRLESESGDFIVLRRDGLIAYQLAVVVDDHLQAITNVVRGIDLLDSTPRQIALQQLLGYTTPDYYHIPVAINDQGQKLSKSHGAWGISPDAAEKNLFIALQVLAQKPPTELQCASLTDIWKWAQQHWDIDVLRGQSQIAAELSALAVVKNGLS